MRVTLPPGNGGRAQETEAFAGLQVPVPVAERAQSCPHGLVVNPTVHLLRDSPL